MDKATTHKRILIGCNERHLLNILTLALQERGIEVDGARTHKELLRRCQRQHYALIITRFTKPILTDSSFPSLHRRCDHLPPIFVLSHTHDQRIVMRLLEKGISQFLSLPISLSRLCCKVERQLNSYHSKQ